MAYSPANPPRIIVPRDGPGAPAVWSYQSNDLIADVKAANYFTNGENIGLRNRDWLLFQRVTSDGATFNGAPIVCCVVQTFAFGGQISLVAPAA